MADNSGITAFWEPPHLHVITLNDGQGIEAVLPPPQAFELAMRILLELARAGVLVDGVKELDDETMETYYQAARRWWPAELTLPGGFPDDA